MSERDRPSNDISAWSNRGIISTGNITLHIHLHSEKESTIHKLTRIINNVIGTRTIAIEQSDSLSENQLQRVVCGRIENR